MKKICIRCGEEKLKEYIDADNICTECKELRKKNGKKHHKKKLEGETCTKTDR